MQRTGRCVKQCREGFGSFPAHGASFHMQSLDHKWKGVRQVVAKALLRIYNET